MNNRLSFAALLCLTQTATAQTSTSPAPTASTTPGQTTPPAVSAPKPLATVAGFSLSAQLRTRVESWNWFEAHGFDDDDTFTGTQIRLNSIRTGRKADIGIDLQQVILTGVGDNTVAPAPQGALGFPGSYRAANGNRDGALSIKQAFVRFKNLGGRPASLRLGRFEFNDGSETTAKDPTLNWLKQQRISQRLIGTFGFTHTGRSFDGAQLTLSPAKGNFTAVVARPTEGVFQVDSNNTIDSTNFAYGSYTRPMASGEARLFGLLYRDGRSPSQSIKTDNRPLPARTADDQEIKVYTVGANFIRTIDSAAGKADLLAWGALQGGDWGALDHRANALALEAGFQPKNLRWNQWFRLGYFRSSGDSNPADGKHGAFFTNLPTPRGYARFPFFNQMNSQDLFAQWIVRPNPKLVLRAEAHSLKLSSGRDLWYLGGGAFQDSGFGMAGRPANGQRNLSTLLDISADYALDPKTNIGLYFGRAHGGSVISQSYPSGNSGHLAYVELSRRF